MTRIIIALALLASGAGAETLHRGKVYQITADRIIIRERMQCTYGPWEQETLPTGATVIRCAKTCQKAHSGCLDMAAR